MLSSKVKGGEAYESCYYSAFVSCNLFNYNCANFRNYDVIK